MTFEEEQGY